MKKYLIVSLILLMLFMTGCNTSDGTQHQPREQPHLYWKDIEVVVIDIDRRHWYASAHWYVINLTVKSDEYGLTESFEIQGSGAFGCPNQWNYKEGQTVKAQLYSWVMDSTGTVTKRKINKVY